MANHPYQDAPNKAFWSRSVSQNWDVRSIINDNEVLIRSDDKVMSAGSCFAANIIGYLEGAQIDYIKTERPHPAFAELLSAETFSYARFSAAYGNIYTARQLLQLLKRCLGRFSPVEDRWVENSLIIDPFRPGLLYKARSEPEFDALTRQHLRLTREAFETATVFIFTLGLTEAWVSKHDGAVFPACPGTVRGTFDPDRHVFKNFSVNEVIADLQEFFDLYKSLNPSVRTILTVSPVPLIATATDAHVVTATTYSKSVLRTAAGEVANCNPNVVYFPAYEIIAGPQAPDGFYEPDRRNVSALGIEAVMDVLLQHCEFSSERRAESNLQISNAPEILSQRLVEAECEEAAADRPLPSTIAR
jgi:GSCFA family